LFMMLFFFRQRILFIRVEPGAMMQTSKPQGRGCFATTKHFNLREQEPHMSTARLALRAKPDWENQRNRLFRSAPGFYAPGTPARERVAFGGPHDVNRVAPGTQAESACCPSYDVRTFAGDTKN